MHKMQNIPLTQRERILYSLPRTLKNIQSGKKTIGKLFILDSVILIVRFSSQYILVMKAIPSHESSWEFNGLYSFISNFRNIQLFLFIFIPGNTYRILSDLKVETDITCITRIAASQVGRTMIMHVETFKMDVIISIDI